jgi:hypothetical protein
MPHLSVPTILIDGLGPEREGDKKRKKKAIHELFDLGRLVTETNFYIQQKQTSIDRDLQVPEQRFALRTACPLRISNL